MSDIKNPQVVKRNLDEVENMLGIIQDSVRRQLPIDPNDIIERMKSMRRKIKFAIDNIRD
jgi:hypothetical protein|tara:strand:+ start:5570 stop:5749 length:180 start_codon:yes stop_codon:yes gene_type:complete